MDNGTNDIDMIHIVSIVGCSVLFFRMAFYIVICKYDPTKIKFWFRHCCFGHFFLLADDNPSIWWDRRLIIVRTLYFSD
jgi:hypothetical protein